MKFKFFIPLPLLFSIFAALTVASPEAFATSAPVSFYPAEGNGNDAMNAHPALVPVIDANNYPGLNFTTGKVGQAFRFTGLINLKGSQTGTYVDFGSWMAFESFSVAMWIRDDATVQSPQATIAPVMQLTDLANGTDWSLNYNSTGNQYLYASSDGVSIGFGISPGTWHQLTITRDGSTHVTNVYLDGQVVGSGTGTGDLFIDPSFVGGLRAGADFNLTTFWEGGIDELRIYDRPISADEVALLSSSSALDVVVPGTANPYLAGMPNGSTACGVDSAPAESPVLVTGLNVSGGATLTFSATGSVDHGGGTPTLSPDGVGSWTRGDENGISGVTYPLDALVGVFLDDTQPDGTAAPASLDFSPTGNVTGGINYSTLSPALKQVFFIGDGVNASGAIQQIVAPVGATRLFLGTTDGCGWSNNTGSFSVRVASTAIGGGPTPTPTPTPAPTPTLTFSETGPSAPGGSIHFTATTASGWNVRVQSSTTPTTEASWSDLAGGGHMTETPANSGNYVLDTTAYPAGGAIYFRAIASKAGQADIVSAPLGPLSLQQASLSVSAKLTSTSDPTNGYVTHTGDYVTFTITFTNLGTAIARNLQIVATVPTFLPADNSGVQQQFSASDISISPGGSYVPASSANALDAKIVWNVGDLGTGLTNFVRFTIHISNKVRINQQLRLNIYSVSSIANPPQPFAIVSGAPSNETNIEGPISFKITQSPSAVAPGGLLTYTFALSNLGPANVQHAVAVVDVPQYTRFAATYGTALTAVAGVKLVTYPAGSHVTFKHVYHSDGTSQVVIDDEGIPASKRTAATPALYPAGDKQHRDSISFNITFQVQWVDPTTILSPTISTVDYGAAFMNDAEYSNFLADYNAAGTTPATPDSVDFISFIEDTTNDIALSVNDSGVVNVTLQGSVANQPVLSLAKVISDLPAQTEADGYGQSINFVQPGDQISFMLVAKNTGKSDALDVYIQDGMPDHTTFVSASLIVPVAKTKTNPFGLSSSNIVPIQDTLGHLRFEGLSLPAGKWATVIYTVSVDSGANAPVAGTFINSDDPNHVPESASTVGSSSTPHTPIGFFGDAPGGGHGNAAIKVIGKALFAQPTVTQLVSKPHVSTDVTATKNALDATYNKNIIAYESAVPLTNPSAPLSYIPGDERYYIHFKNIGNTTAAGVNLDVPLPANTVFYRAGFASLTNQRMPGLILPSNAASAVGWGVEPPTTPSHLGTVRFTFNQIPPVDPKTPGTGEGDVMVEVIVTSNAVQQKGSLVGDPTAPGPSIYDNTVSSTDLGLTTAAETLSSSTLLDVTPAVSGPQLKSDGLLGGIFDFFSPHKTTATFKATPVADATHVPQIGIMKQIVTPTALGPDSVVAGSNFTVTFVIFNYGDRQVPHPVLFFVMPANAKYVSASFKAPLGTNPICNTPPGGPNPGDDAVFSIDYLDPHTAAAITFTLQATGAVGATIDDAKSVLVADSIGLIYTSPTSTVIQAPIVIGATNAPTMTTHTTASMVPINHFIFNGGDVHIIDIGGGNLVAAGGGNIVSAGAGNLVAQGGGNIIAAGAGNVISTGVTTASGLMANQASIVSAGAGNIIAGGGCDIVSAGAGNLVAAGGGNIVSAGAGNLVAQGGGNLITQDGGSLVSGGHLFGSAAGNLVAQGGGNIVSAGAGNLVAQGGGNIVSAGAGNIVSTNGSTAIVLASTPGSTASIMTQSGNIIATGGGNLIAQGGGN